MSPSFHQNPRTRKHKLTKTWVVTKTPTPKNLRRITPKRFFLKKIFIVNHLVHYLKLKSSRHFYCEYSVYIDKIRKKRIRNKNSKPPHKTPPINWEDLVEKKIKNGFLPTLRKTDPPSNTPNL